MRITTQLKTVFADRTERLHWRLRTRMLLLTTLVIAGFTLSTFMWTVTLNQVKVGGVFYSRIKDDKDSLERIALLLSNLNQVNAGVFHLIAENDPDRVKATIAKLQQLKSEVSEKFKVVSKLLDSEEKVVAVKDAEATWKEFAGTLDEDLIPAVQQNNRAKARELALEIQSMRYDRFTEQVGAIVDVTKLEIEDLETASRKTISRKIFLTVSLSGGLVFLLFISSLLVTRSVTQPIRQGVDFACAVAEGNLSETLKERRGDEVGELVGALNGMVGSLNGMVRKVSHSTEELSQISASLIDAASRVVKASQVQASGVTETSSAVNEISASLNEVAQWVDQLSRAASESSSSILEMTASVEEVALNMENLSQSAADVSSSIIQISGSIRQVNDGVTTLMDASTTAASSMTEMDIAIRQIEQYATETAGIADTVCCDAERGRTAVEATISGIDEIRLSSLVTSEVIGTLVERTGDIDTILRVIAEVAEQTNLLALNAAIIAAQAGEHGRGFSVVAGEIKELAERTKRSTREIAEVIRGVQNETQRAVKAIKIAEQSIVNGGELSANAGAALNEIVAGAEKASGQMAQIAKATVEQAKGSQIIRNAMGSVTGMVEQFARASQEQSNSSELIRSAVGRMEGLSAQVRNSTREQSKAGCLIARSTENISEMILQIKRACDEQSRGGEQIVVAVGEIQQSAQINLDTATIMSEAANKLAGQVNFLHQEMRVFHV